LYLVRPTYLLKKCYPKAIWRKDISQNKIYLTFDDGPEPSVTPNVLDVLKKNGIKATFFCVGGNIEKNPEIFQRILNEHHQVGNHTFDHMNGWNTHSKNYFENIEKCGQFVKSKLFRPPYGKIKRSQFSHIASLYSIIMWDVLSGDYDKNTSPAKCLENSTSSLRNGSIIVFHDSIKAKEKVEFALPRFIEFAKMKGFVFETL